MKERLGFALLLLAGCALPAADLPTVDLQRSAGGTLSMEDGALRADLTPEGSNSHLRVIFREPLATAGKERLVLVARAVEPTTEGLTVAQLLLLDERGRVALTYEPDLRFEHQWNLRELLFSELGRGVPAQLGGIELNFWSPDSAGQTITFRIERIAVQSLDEVAAELVPPPAPPPTPVAPSTALVTPSDQRWTSIGPGGGGWYRTIAISPHDGTCLVGADVGGIYRSTDGCQTWQMVNDGVANRYVNCIAFHPTDPRIVFAGSNGGPLKSVDGGQTWAMKRAGLPPLQTYGESAPISALAVHPDRPQVVLAGVGHERSYGLLPEKTVGGRIYWSTDGGESWTLAELPGGEAIRRVSVLDLDFDPRQAGLVYATTQAGLFRSLDDGHSWQRFGGAFTGYAPTFLALSRDDPQRLLLAYHRGPDKSGGVLLSTDGGATWRQSNAGLPRREDAWRLILDPVDPRTFYVGWHRGFGLYVSRDAGESWAAMNDGKLHSAWFFTGRNVTGLAIDPRDPRRILFCNDMEIYQTLDAGRRWDQVCTDLARPATATAPPAWRGRGAEVICMGGPQAIAVDPTDPRRFFLAFWDCHGWGTDDGGQSFFRLTDGLHSHYGRMGCIVLDPADARVMYVTLGANYDRQRVHKSVDGGRRFRLVGHPGSGLPPGGIFSLVIDPASPLERRTLYAAVTGFGVYRSDDGGLSWQEKMAGLPADSRNVVQVALDPRDPKRVWLCASAHYHSDTRQRVPGYVARSDDGGEQWRIVKDRIEGQCLVVDPHDSRRVYVGNRNFSGVDYPNAFYRTMDGGETWESLDQTPFLAGLGSIGGDQGTRICMTSLAADPLTPGHLFAGCRDESAYDVSNGRGVFESRDWGATWQPYPPDGLANYSIGTLVVDPANPARLYVGGGGNGAFRWGPRP